MKKASLKVDFPCSICESRFPNPRDLGTHILSEHCDDKQTSPKSPQPPEVAPLTKKSPSLGAHFMNWSTASQEATPIPAAVKAIQMPLGEPKNIVVSGPIMTTFAAPNPPIGNVITLPRPPTAEEQKQKFIILKVDEHLTRYVCLLCQKEYTSRYNIRMHMNMHSGKNVHTCDFCGRFFAHKHVFESHVRTHTGERPFSCNKCGRSFGDRSNRLSHQKKCKGEPDRSIANVKSNTIVINNLRNNNHNNNNNNINGNNGTGNMNNNGQNNEVYEYLEVGQIKSEDEDEDEEEEDLEEIEEEEDMDDDGGEEGDDNDDDQDMAGKFEPQIVSVESIGQNGINDDSDDVIVPNEKILNELDYDDIIDDSLYDEDLEEIQIEPDIIDYDDDMDTDQDTNPAEKSGVTVQMYEEPQSGFKVENPSFSCSFCHEKFKEQSVLLKHLKTHLKFSRIPSQTDLNIGYTKQGIPKGQFMCLFCGKLFVKEEQVKIHKNVHLDENSYNCRFCNQMFSNFKVFEDHMKTHGDANKMNCVHCNAPYASRHALVQHQMTCSMNLDVRTSRKRPPNPQQSVTVSLQYASSPEAKPIPALTPIAPKMPSVSITPLQPTPITVTLPTEPVPMASVTPKELRKSPRTPGFAKIKSNPVEIPSSDGYKPDNNSNNVINRNDIQPPPNDHELVQGFCQRRLVNGQTRLICVTCGKHYTTMYNMRQHRNIHTGKGLHSCRFCGKCFTHKHIWETHERIHTGEKPFKCNHCSKGFADRSNYNSHRKLCSGAQS